MKIFRYIAIALLLLSLGIATITIKEYIKADAINNEIKEENVREELRGLNEKAEPLPKEQNGEERDGMGKEPPYPDMLLNINHNSLYERNEDYRGWLEVDGMDISYPVVKAPDNEYYLHKDFDGKYLYAGTLFIDAYSSKGIDQDNLIIYGHNMKNGSMFGKLKQLANADGFEKHKYIKFYTPYGNKAYLIYSVRTAKADINSPDYKLEDINVKEYIGMCKDAAGQFRESVLNLNNLQNRQLITLVVCNGNSSERLLVSGIEIRAIS